MTRSELVRSLRLLSSGTVAVAIGSSRYVVIDRAISNAIIYASETATDEEITPCCTLADVLSFLTAHKDNQPAWII